MDDDNDSLPPMHFIEESKEEQSARHCIIQDIGQILAMFVAKRINTFAGFKACWDQLDFSLIHGVKPEELTRAWYYECIFDEVIGQLFVTDSLIWRCGVIYLAYLLHQSQPLGVQRFPIFVSEQSWKIIIALWRSSLKESNNLEDLKKILAILKGQNGFCIKAMTRKQSIEAYKSHKHQLLEESNPTEALVEIDKELQRLRQVIDESFSGIPGRTQTEGLQSMEDTYVREKDAVAYAFSEQHKLNLIRRNLSKDFGQAQVDWERLRTEDEIGKQSKKRKTSGRVSPVNSQASSTKGRRSTLQEPFTRPSTAPPMSNIMNNVEDMPPII